MYISRFINVLEKTKVKSMFLFGPRQTGKSSLVRHSLPAEAVTFNLLDHAVFLKLSADPTLLRQQLLKKHNDASNRLVVVDEIQKLPVLLDEVHLLIEEYGYRFILTGSSARKLRRAGVNLLGGRARNQYLHPLSFIELG
ncbi:MAG: AAA family ATPase, partial [Proteobacteria bacterium]|nr:AAA family ATPase [Pseudomonadota bacterium]